MKPKVYRALGLMSGTSIDGIDAALIETDGYDYIRPLAFLSRPFPEPVRNKLRHFLGNELGAKDPAVASFEQELTALHADISNQLLAEAGGGADVVGFHGQTLYHNPARRITVQIGDGDLLARLLAIDVINDFRTADVLAGGNGAPLVPLFLRALVSKMEKPVLLLNIGGVSNLTWIAGPNDDQIMAFDVGPGNALIDDWVHRHTGQPFDKNGILAAGGNVDHDFVEKVMGMEYFKKSPPKSLDRDAFANCFPDHLDAADGAATLTMITARAAGSALAFLPNLPQAIHVSGGGRHNSTLMRWIGDVSGLKMGVVDQWGWSGDGLEAEAFGWLAVRSMLGLPLSVPNTTGVSQPLTGGHLHKA